MLGNSPLSWKSRRQSVIVGSSTEDLVTLTTCEVIWITQLLKESRLQKLSVAILKCANKCARNIGANRVHHEKTTHRSSHFLRVKQATNPMKSVHVPTSQEIVDVLNSLLFFTSLEFILLLYSKLEQEY